MFPVLHCHNSLECFCSTEVRAMVVAVQQPSAEYTAILTVCIVDVEHRPLPCAMTIQKNLQTSSLEWIPRQCPHPRSKVNVLATHQTT